MKSNEVAERLANEVYDLHIEYERIFRDNFVSSSRPRVEELATLHRAIVQKSVALARAVLEARVPEQRWGEP